MSEQAGSDAMPGAPAGAVTEKVNFPYHAVIGLAMGLVSFFTALAWPFAILTGVVIGRSEANRLLGRPRQGTVVNLLAVTGGVLAMLFFGAVIGGLFAFAIVALMAFSERISARASDTDRGIARILTIVIAVVTWLVAVAALKLNVSVNLGG
jgi:hypothetical protein